MYLFLFAITFHQLAHLGSATCINPGFAFKHESNKTIIPAKRFFLS